MSRGFSLFTPLVGTALVIMSILVATTMIENDVRFSRSISNSFTISSQSIGAKLIMAAATMQIVDNIQKIAYEELGRDIEVSCSTVDACKSQARSILAGVGSTLQVRIVGEGFYTGVSKAIEETTAYSPIPPDCGCTDTDVKDRTDCCLAKAMAETPGAVTTGFDAEGRLEVVINSALLHREEFSVGFRDKYGNTLYLSIAPQLPLPVKVGQEIEGMIEDAAKAFIDGSDIARPYVSWDRTTGKAVFDLGDGREFKITFIKQ